MYIVPFRFNEREHDDADRFVSTMARIHGRRLTFAGLTAREQDL